MSTCLRERRRCHSEHLTRPAQETRPCPSMGFTQCGWTAIKSAYRTRRYSPRPPTWRFHQQEAVIKLCPGEVRLRLQGSLLLSLCRQFTSGMIFASEAEQFLSGNTAQGRREASSVIWLIRTVLLASLFSVFSSLLSLEGKLLTQYTFILYF